jgi:hypothetical protein
MADHQNPRDLQIQAADVRPLEWLRAVRESTTLSAAEKRLWVYGTYADSDTGGSVHPGDARVASDVGVHVQTVKTWRKSLTEKGYLRLTRKGHGANRHASIYQLTIPKVVSDATLVDPKVVSDATLDIPKVVVEVPKVVVEDPNVVPSTTPSLELDLDQKNSATAPRSLNPRSRAVEYSTGLPDLKYLRKPIYWLSDGRWRPARGPALPGERKEIYSGPEPLSAEDESKLWAKIRHPKVPA